MCGLIMLNMLVIKKMLLCVATGYIVSQDCVRSYMYVSDPVSCTSIVLNILFCFIYSFYIPITFLVLAIFQRIFA